jgi:pimeloyl-ACP methyl ester carboxylesterase
MNATDATSPTIVLVHGAYAESASWNGVIADLRRRGYTTIAAANQLRGLEHDAAYVRSVLESVSGPIVLVGHSYGGSVMSEAAEGVAGVSALVYVASFLLDVGESTDDLVTKFPGARLGSAAEPVPFPGPGGDTGTEFYIRHDRFHELFAADIAPDEAAVLAATQRPIAGAALTEAATKAAWKTIPSWTLIATQDLAIPADAARFMGRPGRLDDRRDRRLPRRHRVPTRRCRRPHRHRRPRHRPWRRGRGRRLTS